MSNKKILIIDDEQDLLELLKDQLEIFGHSVAICNGPEYSTEMIKKDSYDWVIIDIMMPLLNGLEVIELIKQTSTVKFMILSGYADLFRNDPNAKKADAIVLKPYDINELNQIISA
jgi:CheY-like chemotaxis protein